MMSATLLAVLTGCAPTGFEGGDTNALGDFHAQELAWEDCERYAVTSLDERYFPLAPEAECARLDVPLDYSAPRGETASVAIVRIAARGRVHGVAPAQPGRAGRGPPPHDDGRLGDAGAPPLTEEDTAALAERCTERSRRMQALANVGTRRTANDMDILREPENTSGVGRSRGGG